MTTAQREYRQLACRDLGTDCDFLVRAEKEDEVMALVSEHVCRVHGRFQITPEMKDKIFSGPGNYPSGSIGGTTLVACKKAISDTRVMPVMTKYKVARFE